MLTTELAEFCQCGLSVIVASCRRDGRPVAGLALGCRIDETGTVRLLLRAPANKALLEAVSAGAALAATFSLPSSHRSIQLKAATARIAAVRDEDRPVLAAQCAGFAAELVGAGYTPVLAAVFCAYAPDELVALEFVPERAFVQTPGPGAGSDLRP